MKQDHPRQPQDVGRDGQQDRPQDSLDRLTVAQAADRLGITQDAVRKRIARETIRHDKDYEGRIFVYLDTFERKPKTDQDNGQDGGSKTVPDADQDKYTRSLEDQIGFLRRELERKDAIIMQMAQANAALAARVPELEAATQPREAPETASDLKPGVDPRGDDAGADTGTSRPSWWRRIFSG